MLRSTFLALIVAGSAFAADRPNVVVIVADDLGWADLGCYGSTYHKTPNLDKLAAAGTRFTQAYAACPVCSPTRAALLTGLYPARLGITDWLPGRPDRPDQRLNRPELVTALPDNVDNLAKAFKRAGYATGSIGKWHLGGTGSAPTDHGFDSNIGGDQGGGVASFFAPYSGKAKRTLAGLGDAPAGEYLTDRLAAEAEKYIAAHKDKPFYLHLTHYAPHVPLQAKPEIVAKYKKGTDPGKQGNPIYAAMLESLDDSVGRVMKALDDHKLADKTIVVFTSDNGGLSIIEGPNTPATINSPLREGKGWLYEGGLRVPLIVRVPGFAARTLDQPASSIDLMPTLLEACLIESESVVDGMSLLPNIRGSKVGGRTSLYWHYPHYSNQGGKPGGAIRNRDLKLVEFYETGRRELFDVAKDPGENKNLAAERPEIVKALADQLDRWRKQVGAKLPTENPDYVPNPPDKDGTILLHSCWADVHGTMLRYEPLPHKTTLGYWVNVDDWASWEFTATAPGKYRVEVLQGCGKGQGGSKVDVVVGKDVLNFTVEDTGHFQNFVPRDLGTVTIVKAGRHTLEIRPKTKAAGAIMDVRQVTLKPVK